MRGRPTRHDVWPSPSAYRALLDAFQRALWPRRTARPPALAAEPIQPMWAGAACVPSSSGDAAALAADAVRAACGATAALAGAHPHVLHLLLAGDGVDANAARAAGEAALAAAVRGKNWGGWGGGGDGGHLPPVLVGGVVPAVVDARTGTTHRRGVAVLAASLPPGASAYGFAATGTSLPELSGGPSAWAALATGGRAACALLADGRGGGGAARALAARLEVALPPGLVLAGGLVGGVGPAGWPTLLYSAHGGAVVAGAAAVGIVYSGMPARALAEQPLATAGGEATVTRCAAGAIHALDGRPALAVLDELRQALPPAVRGGALRLALRPPGAHSFALAAPATVDGRGHVRLGGAVAPGSALRLVVEVEGSGGSGATGQRRAPGSAGRAARRGHAVDVASAVYIRAAAAAGTTPLGWSATTVPDPTTSASHPPRLPPAVMCFLDAPPAAAPPHAGALTGAVVHSALAAGHGAAVAGVPSAALMLGGVGGEEGDEVEGG